MDKHKKYVEKLKSQGLCPHCGKPCAPYKECFERREYKRLARKMMDKSWGVRGPYKEKTDSRRKPRPKVEQHKAEWGGE